MLSINHVLEELSAKATCFEDNNFRYVVELNKKLSKGESERYCREEYGGSLVQALNPQQMEDVGRQLQVRGRLNPRDWPDIVIEVSSSTECACKALVSRGSEVLGGGKN